MEMARVLEIARLKSQLRLERTLLSIDRFVTRIQDEKEAVKKGVELRLSASNQSIAWLQNQCKELETKNEQLEEALMVMSTNVMEVATKGGRKGADAEGEEIR
jgi:hypothetical protein